MGYSGAGSGLKAGCLITSIPCRIVRDISSCNRLFIQRKLFGIGLDGFHQRARVCAPKTAKDNFYYREIM